MFSSQAKSTVFPRQLTTAITEAVYKELCDMNQTKLNDLVEIVIQNNRVRKEGERVRNIATETKKKQWSTPDSYLPCASIKTPQPKEIFLCEGKSARGGISSARNAKFQAILMFQGKAPNVWDMTLDQALKSTVWFDLVKLLGCGIGSNFDIKKLNFDKIIIATDADVDGYHIRVSICAFFLRFMPELLEAGKVYIAEPPLYKLMRGKNISYVASQTEYIQECIRSVGNIQLEFPEVKD
jgi:DNA gyrase subunit B